MTEKLKEASESNTIVGDAIAEVKAGKVALMLTFAVGDASKNKAADYNLTLLSDILEHLK